MNQDLLKRILSKQDVIEYILANGTHPSAADWIRSQYRGSQGPDSL